MPNSPTTEGPKNRVVLWQDQLRKHIAQARTSIMIHSCDLSEDWLQLPYSIEQIAAEAKRGSRTFQVLVNQTSGNYDPQHPLASLAQLMPDQISLKAAAPDQATMDKGFIVIDSKIGTWLKPLISTSDSSWMRPHHAEQLGQWFQKTWEKHEEKEQTHSEKLLWQDQLNRYLEESVRSIMIHSHGLKEEWLRSPSALDKLSQEARRGYRTIQILVNEANNFRQRSHPLVQLLKQIPSLIHVRAPSATHAEIHESFVIIDEKVGTWLRPMNQSSSTCWIRPYRAKQLGHWYKEAWEFGKEAVNFRDFRI